MRLHDIQVSINALNAVDKIQTSQQAQLQAAAAQQMLHMKKNIEHKEHLVTETVQESEAAAIDERTPKNKDMEKNKIIKKNIKVKNSETAYDPNTNYSENHIIDIKA